MRGKFCCGFKNGTRLYGFASLADVTDITNLMKARSERADINNYKFLPLVVSSTVSLTVLKKSGFPLIQQYGQSQIASEGTEDTTEHRYFALY